MSWKCPVCGKEFEHFGIKEFAMCPKTTLFGNFKYKDADGNIKTINRKTNQYALKNVNKRTKNSIL